MANFFCEMDTRLNVPSDVDKFPLPLTQHDLGQICGLTPVHVNRVMKDLREGGCCTLRNGYLAIHARGRLAAVGDFNPDEPVPAERWTTGYDRNSVCARVAAR